MLSTANTLPVWLRALSVMSVQDDVNSDGVAVD